MLLANSEYLNTVDTDEFTEANVRFRTVGDMTCTAAIESGALSAEEVLLENLVSRQSERGARVDDKRSEAALEDRKKEGYF